MTRETEIVTKTTPEGKVYYGFRIFLKSHPDLHHYIDDDDRSAITFFFDDKLDCEYHASYWKMPGGAVKNQPYREGGLLTDVIDGPQIQVPGTPGPPVEPPTPPLRDGWAA